MKRLAFILAAIILLAQTSVFAYSDIGPMCTQDDSWKSVVDNAYQVAEQYAVAHNPRSTFETSIEDYQFIKQEAGQFKGKYLLMITTVHGKDVNSAVLYPLFDVDQPSYNLNIGSGKPLWRLLRAELNGKSY